MKGVEMEEMELYQRNITLAELVLFDAELIQTSMFITFSV
jgi:hypothetical protein